MSSFGSRLQEERARLGISQQQFAELGGIKRSSQYLYEHDARCPDAEYLARIARAGVDIAYLIEGQSRPQVEAVPSSLTEAQALAAFRAVEAFTRKHEAAGVSLQERERFFSFLCHTLATSTPAETSVELPDKLVARWAG
jgi:transcriptional regulator with XRE-family HTH domain